MYSTSPRSTPALSSDGELGCTSAFGLLIRGVVASVRPESIEPLEPELRMATLTTRGGELITTSGNGTGGYVTTSTSSSSAGAETTVAGCTGAIRTSSHSGLGV
eukprot:3065917-Pyramimonas_sp.AAC.2